MLSNPREIMAENTRIVEIAVGMEINTYACAACNLRGVAETGRLQELDIQFAAHDTLPGVGHVK